MIRDFDEDRLATPTEACREYARNYGMDHPDEEWILTDFDTWEHNPFYNSRRKKTAMALASWMNFVHATK